MRRRRQTRSLPPLQTTATLAADTADSEQRTVEATVYSGARVARFPLFDDSYWLSMEVSRKAVDLGRVNAGVAPVLDSHKSYAGVRGVLGRVERAWLANGEVRAQLRFSRRPDVDGVWQDVTDGILSAVSVGVVLHEVEEVAKAKGDPDDDMAHFRATRWEVREVSVVPVGADPSARIEAASDSERHPCRLTLMDDGGKTMRFKKCPQCKTKLAADYDGETCPAEECGADLAEAAAEREEHIRVGRLTEISRFYDTGEVLLRGAIDQGTTAEDFIELAEEARRKRTRIGPNDIGTGADYDAPGTRVEMMAEGLVARATRKEPSEPGRRYAGSTLAELALECLSWRGAHRGLDVRHDAARIVELALHTTSDYPLILANTVNRMMLPEYEQAAPTYRAICAVRSFRDFRPHQFLRLGDFPDLLETGEHGEIQHGTISESGETVTAANYARIYGITRRVLVNDDVGAFADLAIKAGRRVAAFENALFYSVLTSGAGLGPTLSDGDTLFHSNHGNTGTGAIDVTNVGLGVAAMMKQAGLDGVKLNIEPSVLLVSPDRIAVARQFVAQNLRPTQPSEANPFANLTALADANLTAAAPWYLFTSPGVAASFVYGYLEGAEGPRIDTRAGWETEGVEMRVSLDFGVGATDYRGAFRSTGS